MKSVLLVAVVSTAFTLTAAESLLSPRAKDIRLPVAASTVKDPNLTAQYPQAGTRTTGAAPAVTAGGVKDPDVLGAVTKCTMAPKAKGTAACAKHCEMAGK